MHVNQLSPLKCFFLLFVNNFYVGHIVTVTPGSVANIGELSAQHSAVNIEKEDKETVLEIVKDLGQEVNEVQLWHS